MKGLPDETYLKFIKDGMMIANWHGWAYIYFKIVTQSNLFGSVMILTLT